MFSSLQRHDWNFWMWWLFYTTISSVIALVAIVFILRLLNLPFLDLEESASPTLVDQVLAALIFGVSGSIIGLGQWLGIRMLISRAGWWILASGAGWLAGYSTNLLVAELAGDRLNPAVALFLPWFVIGLWSGLFEWLVLRRHYRRADAWIVVHGLALLVGALGWIVGSVCGGVLSWSVTGAITGYALLRFEASRADKESQPHP
jgi:hypothetical protein